MSIPHKTTAVTFVRPRTSNEAIALAVCARSTHHSAGTGTHDAAVFGPCTHHSTMATEMAGLIPTDAALYIEWGISTNNGNTYLRVTGGEQAARHLAEEDPDITHIASRVTLRSQREGHLIDAPWFPR